MSRTMSSPVQERSTKKQKLGSPTSPCTTVQATISLKYERSASVGAELLESEAKEELSTVLRDTTAQSQPGNNLWVGNQRGFYMMSTEEQHVRYAPLLNITMDEYFTVRMAVFESILEPEARDRTVVDKRNEACHAPQVATDVIMMDEMRQLLEKGMDTALPPAFERYQETFRKIYGRSFTIVKRTTEQYPWTAAAFNARGRVFLDEMSRCDSEKEDLTKAFEDYIAHLQGLPEDQKTPESLRYYHLMIRAKLQNLERAKKAAIHRQRRAATLQPGTTAQQNTSSTAQS